jgi:hypothetical protein
MARSPHPTPQELEMDILVQLDGITERWNPDDDTYIHCVHLVFAGHTFDFQVSEEVAAEVARASKGPRSGIADAGEDSEGDEPPADPMDGFRVAMPDAASEESVPVPSARGRQPVPRGNVKDASSSEGDGEAFSQG